MFIHLSTQYHTVNEIAQRIFLLSSILIYHSYNDAIIQHMFALNMRGLKI